MSTTDCKKLMDLAWQQFGKKDFQASADSFAEVIDVEENNINALYGRACALYKVMDYDAAEKDLNKILKNKSTDIKALHVRALIRGIDDNYESAAKDLEKIVEHDSQNAEAYLDLAFAYLLMDKLNEAALAFDQLVDLHKNCPQGWYGKGLVALFKKEHKKATEYFNLAIKAEPNYILALLARADSLMEMGKVNDAKRDIKKVLNADPNIFKKKPGQSDDDIDDESIDEDTEIEEFDLDD